MAFGEGLLHAIEAERAPRHWRTVSALTRRTLFTSVLLSAATFGCSDDDGSGTTSTKLECPVHVQRCDVHSSQCRQRIFDYVGCVRGHSTRERQPPIEFIKLSDLLEAVQAAEMEAPDPDADAQRRALSLLGLVASSDVAATEAAAERVQGIAALYLPESKQVVMIEDPGGTEPSEEELGLPIDVFNMSVLAHEYVHAYQDREYDLGRFQSNIPDNFDGQLAAISAIEGEATLYEYEFLLDVLDRQDADRRKIFEALVDAAETTLAESDSPWLAARSIFPYTYGGHSAWSVEQTDGALGLERLRNSETTLSYLERRWGALERSGEATRVGRANDAGLEKVTSDDLGAWLLNGFMGRAVTLETDEALRVARQWSSDELSVWRGPDDEVLVHWVVGYASADAANSDWSWAEQAQVLADRGSPIADAKWLVSNREQSLVITASTNSNGSALARLHTSNELDETTETMVSNADSGIPLPTFAYQRVASSVNLRPKETSLAERARRENAVRRRLFNATSSLLRGAK